MTTSNKGKKYEAPKIYKVVLSHDQAILSGCTTGTTSLSTNNGGNCRNTGTLCRRTSGTTSINSAANS